MQITLKSPVLALETGQLLALDDVAGACIAPRRGAVWITEEGRHQDSVVKPGESHCITRQGRTVVQAFEPTLISIRESPARPPRGDDGSTQALGERLADLRYRFFGSRYF